METRNLSRADLKECSWRECIDGKLVLNENPERSTVPSQTNHGRGVISHSPPPSSFTTAGLLWLHGVHMTFEELLKLVGPLEVDVTSQIETDTFCLQHMCRPFCITDLVETASNSNTYRFDDNANGRWQNEVLAELRGVLPADSVIYMVARLWPLKLFELEF
jgi:hypothetical protein